MKTQGPAYPSSCSKAPTDRWLY